MDTRELSEAELLAYSEKLDQAQRDQEALKAASAPETFDLRSMLTGIFDWINGLFMAMGGKHPHRIWEHKQAMKEQRAAEKAEAEAPRVASAKPSIEHTPKADETPMGQAAQKGRKEFNMAAAGKQAYTAPDPNLEPVVSVSPAGPTNNAT